MIRCLPLLLFFLALPSVGLATSPFNFSSPARGAEPSPTPPSKPPAAEEANAKNLAQLNGELTQTRQSLVEAGSGPDTALLQHLQTQVELLEKLGFAYQEIADTLQRRSESVAQKKALQDETQTWKSGVAPKGFPVSFAEFDKLSGQLKEEEKRQDSFEAALKASQENLEGARKNLEEAEQERRRAKEDFETGKDGSEAAKLQRKLLEAQTRSRLSAAKLQLRELDLENEKLTQKNSSEGLNLLRLQVAWLQQKVKFTADDLAREIHRLDLDEIDSSKRLAAAREKLAKADRDWADAQKRESELTEPSAAMTEEVHAKRQARQSLQGEIAVLLHRLQAIGDLKEIWKGRYQALDGKMEKSDIGPWKLKAQQALQQLRRQENLLGLNFSDLRKKRTDLKESREKLAGDSSALVWVGIEEEEVNKLVELFRDHRASIARAEDFYEKFIAELDAEAGKIGVGDRLGILWGSLKKIWNFEVASIDDRPITVSKIVLVLVLLVLGFLFARRVSRLLERKVFPRFGMDAGIAAGLQTLAFYLLLLFVTLLALYMVNVPLTMFTVLGGALAIGVGFGSQNIVNNFISGLILLMERPMKVGDYVEVEGSSGVVEKIGARSTRILTFNNSHLILPNSSFLEKRFTNWTLADDLVRISIRVGVAYDSPTRDVNKILRKAVEEHGKVLKSPEPIVLFTDFGESALVFEVHFWIRMRTALERRSIESDLRFLIDSAFKDAGIIIAFPQRDVRLDATKGFEVRLVSSPEGNKP